MHKTVQIISSEKCFAWLHICISMCFGICTINRCEHSGSWGASCFLPLFSPFTPTKVLTKENGLVVTAEADPNSKAGSTKTSMSQQCFKNARMSQQCFKWFWNYAWLSRKVSVPQPLSICCSNPDVRPPLIFIRDQIPHPLWTKYWMGYADMHK